MKICPVGTELLQTDRHDEVNRRFSPLLRTFLMKRSGLICSIISAFIRRYWRKDSKPARTADFQKKIRIWEHLIRSKNVKKATAMIRSTILKNQFAVSNFIVHGLPIRKQWPPGRGIRASVPVLFCGEHHSKGEEVNTKCAETYVRASLLTVLFTKYY